MAKNKSKQLPDGMIESPFFGEREQKFWIGKNRHAFAYINQFPVSKGHSLILPLRRAVTMLDLTKIELRAHFLMLKKLMFEFNKHGMADGFNIGWNIGTAAGQSVGHTHLHIIPRTAAANKKMKPPIKGGICRLGVGHLHDFYNQEQNISPDEMADYIQKETVLENERACLVRAQYGLNDGHVWIVLKNTQKNFDKMSLSDFMACMDLVKQYHAEYNAEGYNVGWNIGTSAGAFSTSPILHIIPRQKGDVEIARGGILRAIPDIGDYYKPENTGKDIKVKKWHDVPFRF